MRLPVCFQISSLVLICVLSSPGSALSAETIKLPKPEYRGKLTVEEAIEKRRSVREFRDAALSMAEVSQLLWAAQGITSPWGYRSAPSAGALYPLEVYLVAGKVEGLEAGIYRYRPKGHELIRVKDGDRREELCRAALSQQCVRNAAAVLVITGVYKRTARKYGERATRYVHIEVGHAGQNVYLQAVSLGLGTVMMGAFSDDGVREVLGMRSDEQPLGIMPVGRPR